MEIILGRQTNTRMQVLWMNTALPNPWQAEHSTHPFQHTAPLSRHLCIVNTAALKDSMVHEFRILHTVSVLLGLQNAHGCVKGLCPRPRSFRSIWLPFNLTSDHISDLFCQWAHSFFMVYCSPGTTNIFCRGITPSTAGPLLLRRRPSSSHPLSSG